MAIQVNGITVIDDSRNAFNLTTINNLAYPTSDGSSGQVLTTDGSGNLSFTTLSGGGADLSEVDQDILPLFDGVHDIGSENKRWFDVFVENSVDIAGTKIGGTEEGIVVDTLLAGELLVSDNVITPDNISFQPYQGDKGVVIVDGNIDAQGSWIKLPVVETVQENEFGAGSWSSGGNLPSPRSRIAGAGTQDAGLAFGGFDSSAGSFGDETGETLEYNGTSWSSGGSMSTARADHEGAGTQDAALAFGGRDAGLNRIGSTEEYNGTSWSSGGNMIVDRRSHSGAGTQDDALAFGGLNSGRLNSTEEYNGTSWVSSGTMIRSRFEASGAGTQDAALAVSGDTLTQPELGPTEEYNGISWSSGGNMNRARNEHAGAGTQDAALAFGGRRETNGSSFVDTEEYNGISWSFGAPLPANQNDHGGAGTQDAALSFGGRGVNANLTDVTYEYNKPLTTTTVSVPFDGEQGQIRFNKNNGRFEGYDGFAWITLG